jgi:hypothetical protein
MLAMSAYATLADIIADSFYSNISEGTSTIFSALMVVAICEAANSVFLNVSIIDLIFILRLLADGTAWSV